MFRQHPARVVFYLAERDGFKSACTFKAKAKTADSAEKIKDAEFGHVINLQPRNQNLTIWSGVTLKCSESSSRHFQGICLFRHIPTAFLLEPISMAARSI
tara:strand:+ start:914 stop:1213 length:300 start_codon:yes stop_codon:yes gene_type:complete